MALFDAFLKLDGIKGESKDAKHTGEIDVLIVRWGALNPNSIGSQSGGAGAAKMKFDDFCIVKKVDAATPLLFKACATGQHISTGTLALRKAGGQQLDYLTIKLNLVVVKDIQQQGPHGDDVALEEITMAVGSVEMQYQQQGPDGKAQGGPTMASWNVVTNSEDPKMPAS